MNFEVSYWAELGDIFTEFIISGPMRRSHTESSEVSRTDTSDIQLRARELHRSPSRLANHPL
jgi:hypothetical protein